MQHKREAVFLRVIGPRKCLVPGYVRRGAHERERCQAARRGGHQKQKRARCRGPRHGGAMTPAMAPGGRLHIHKFHKTLEGSQKSGCSMRSVDRSCLALKRKALVFAFVCFLEAGVLVGDIYPMS